MKLEGDEEPEVLVLGPPAHAVLLLPASLVIVTLEVLLVSTVYGGLPALPSQIFGKTLACTSACTSLSRWCLSLILLQRQAVILAKGRVHITFQIGPLLVLLVHLSLRCKRKKIVSNY